MAIFGKKDRDPAADSAGDGLADRRDDPRADPATGSGRREPGGATTIGPSLKVKGEVAAEEDMTVEGRLEGILSLSRGLVVSKTGVVEADVRAQSVAVHGRILGNVVAEQKVEIFPSGRLEGNIKSPKISIHEGAHFRGNVDMSGGGQVETAATPAPPRPAAGGVRRG